MTVGMAVAHIDGELQYLPLIVSIIHVQGQWSTYGQQKFKECSFKRWECRYL